MSKQINNPLHGITLQNLLTELVDVYGWEYLAEQVEIRCFMFDPSIKSSLKFLRKTEWARGKVEAIYLSMLESKSVNRSENGSENQSESGSEAGTENINPWAESLNALSNHNKS